MRKSYFEARVKKLKEVYTILNLSDHSSEEYKPLTRSELAKELTMPQYFLSAMYDLDILKDVYNIVTWNITGEPNEALCQRIVDREQVIKAVGTKAKPSRSNPLSAFSDAILIEELKNRGYKGMLSKQIEIEI